MAVYALWDLASETLLMEGEDPAPLLEGIAECRRDLSPDLMPMFGLTEYHPALQTQQSVTGEEAVVAHLEKRLAARQRRERGAT